MNKSKKDSAGETASEKPHEEAQKTHAQKKMDVDQSEGGVAVGEAGEVIPLKYDDEEGSLEKDKALQTYKIPDDDKRWVELEPNDGLKKLVLNEGYGDTPEDGEKVSCHYSGFLQSNGEMFDSSRERGDPFKFEIGKGSVIKGWDKGIATMEVGERAVLRCSSDFAYGENGSGPKIPPKATLDFVVELIDIQKYESVWGTDDAKDTIFKKTVKEGDGYDTPKKLWVVTVTYTGRENDENGRIWCSGKDEKVKIPYDAEFEKKGTISDYDQPRGFYTCLRETKKGEQNYFKLKSNDFYTFGSNGSEKFRIEPNTDLFYDISISEMEKFNMSSWQLDEKEKIPKALELKETANNFFRQKKLAAANEVYKDILDITKSVKEKGVDEEKVNEISLACYSNKALVETQLNNLLEASEQIEKGLEINPKHEKLRYRKALVHFKRGEFALAADLLTDLKKEFPENKGVKSLAIKNNRANKESTRKARKLAKKMFGPSAAKKFRKGEDAKDEKDEVKKVSKDETDNAEGDKIEKEGNDDAVSSKDSDMSEATHGLATKAAEETPDTAVPDAKSSTDK